MLVATVLPNRLVQMLTLQIAAEPTQELWIMAGWKGWTDFSPLAGTPLEEDHLDVINGDLNEVGSMSPTIGSMLGGATARGFAAESVVIVGQGFKLPSTANNITVYHHSGPKRGLLAGECNVTAGQLDRTSPDQLFGGLECEMPEIDLSHWSSTQFEEKMEVEVNGQRYMNDGSQIVFTYSRPRTPIVNSVVPSALSFAVTSNVTLLGFNFGLLKRQVKVMFGQRPCSVDADSTVWDVNQTAITCQLKRTAMVFKPLCTENKDIYNEDCGSAKPCVVKPPNFFVKPTLLVTSRGYAVSHRQSYLDTRFEIHSVWPPVGSEGGAIVTVRGIGFGSSAVTSQEGLDFKVKVFPDANPLFPKLAIICQLTAAALGTLADVESWSPTEVVFVTRKLTLNVEKVDIMTNLISAAHKCGTGPATTTTTTMGQNLVLDRAPVNLGPISEDCNHKAFRAYVTPNVTAMSPREGNAGDNISITINMPDGYAEPLGAGNISVFLGAHACPHSLASKDGSIIVVPFTVQCVVPEFEASTVPIKVRLLPLGYARFPDSLSEFTPLGQLLTIDSVSPDSISKGGGKVTIFGKGFAATPSRHFVRKLNHRAFDEDSANWGTMDLEVSLWDTEVARSPISAFGEAAAGCLRNNDNYRTFNCMSQDLRFAPTNSAFSHHHDLNPTISRKSAAFTFRNSHTPNIELMYTLPEPRTLGPKGEEDGPGDGGDDDGDDRHMQPGQPLRASLGDLLVLDELWLPGDRVFLRVSSPGPLLGESLTIAAARSDGRPVHHEEVISKTRELMADPDSSYLVNITFEGVSGWTLDADSERFLEAEFVPLWHRGIRMGRLNVGTRKTLQSMQSTEAPGYLSPVLRQEVSGVAFECGKGNLLFSPLTLEKAEPRDDPETETTMGRMMLGWTLSLTGKGFAPPPSAGADTYVEVTVCGRPCEVATGRDCNGHIRFDSDECDDEDNATNLLDMILLCSEQALLSSFDVSGTYSSLECIVPN
ncbi:unnamed protein product, partial [Symbiodinium sp. KB8]